MVDLSRPPAGARRSRSIALWKDAHSQAREIELDQGADGVLLNLYTESFEEWTADGRTDGGSSSYPRLSGYHVVRLR